ncbi:hypothetical protein, partial [Cellulosimicrobium funkei]
MAAWSFSSFDTSPRHTSDDTVSYGPKCSRAKVDFPEPDTPTSTTRLDAGTRSSRVVLEVEVEVEVGVGVGVAPAVGLALSVAC